MPVMRSKGVVWCGVVWLRGLSMAVGSRTSWYVVWGPIMYMGVNNIGAHHARGGI